MDISTIIKCQLQSKLAILEIVLDLSQIEETAKRQIVDTSKLILYTEFSNQYPGELTIEEYCDALMRVVDDYSKP